MALNFPSNPTNGDYDSTGKWQFSSTPSPGVWKAVSNQQTVIQPSPVPPANPVNGNMWYNTNEGTIYVYYNDGNTAQWVEAKANSSLGTTLANRVDQLEIKSPNYIINGAFDIWQRGTSVNVNDGGYGPDRLRRSSNGTGTYNFSRQTFTPGSAPVSGYEGEFFCRYTISSAAGQGYNTLQQPIENVRTLAGQTGTFSVWLKTTSGTLSVTPELHQYFGVDGSSDVVVSGSAWTVTTSWQRFTVTFNVPSISGKTIGTNHWLAVDLKLPLNTNFTLDMWGMQLEEGTVATPFRRNANSIQGELAACQRYYYRLGDPGVGGASFTYYGTARINSGTAAEAVIKNPVTMRTSAQSIEFLNTITSDQTNANITVTGITISTGQTTPDNTHVLLTYASGGTAGRMGYFLRNGSAASYFGVSAEL